jgi:carboxyl-terminal processing protease
LKGEKCTTVKVGINRSSSNKILSFNIKREDVPIKSIDTYYMQTSNIGYIKISNFGGKTYQEFLVALASLKQQKATAFIIDLRGNPGGYLDAVIQMVNEFLERGDLIVYTEGRKYNREEVFADGSGSCKKDKVVILIDEFSASAAEIFAGAIQDNDRGTIIGRRSFGKGLVQQQFSLSDGSAVRLTTAKYYTPSGRCIQRPYQKGNREAYNMDIMTRYLHGEFVNKDSIKHVDTTKYYTKKRRIVYGGGGIMPDIFVAKDTIGFTPYFNKLADNGLIYSFAFKYADEHRKILQNIKQWDNLYLHLQCQPILNSFVKYAEQNGIKQNPGELHQSSKLIMHMIYSYIAQNVAEDNVFYRIYNNNDKCIEEAIKAIQQ